MAPSSRYSSGSGFCPSGAGGLRRAALSNAAGVSSRTSDSTSTFNYGNPDEAAILASEIYSSRPGCSCSRTARQSSINAHAPSYTTGASRNTYHTIEVDPGSSSHRSGTSSRSASQSTRDLDTPVSYRHVSGMDGSSSRCSGASSSRIIVPASGSGYGPSRAPGRDVIPSSSRTIVPASGSSRASGRDMIPSSVRSMVPSSLRDMIPASPSSALPLGASSMEFASMEYSRKTSSAASGTQTTETSMKFVQSSYKKSSN